MTKKHKEPDDAEDTIKRLTEENSQWRKSHQEAKAVIARRAPRADGLSFKSSVITILNQRDLSEDKALFYRDEIKKILNFLSNSEMSDKQKINKLKKQINLFLFQNKI